MSAAAHTGGILLRDAALVLTMDPASGNGPLGALEHADVLMESGVITAVGAAIRPPPGTETVDAGGRLVLPGFVDAHTHLWQSAIRGRGSALGFYEWFSACVWTAVPRIGPEDMYHFVRLSAADTLQSGTTTVVDWVPALDYPVSEAYVEAVSDSGLRFAHATYQELPDIELVSKVLQDLVGPHPLGTGQVATCATRQDAEQVRVHAELARELGAVLNLHLLEDPTDRLDDPVSLLAESDALGPRTLLNHVIHVTENELDLLAGHGAAVVHCPLSNMRLGTGVMPIAKAHRRGMRIGLGQDGGANDSGDMFASMKAAVGLHRAVSLDASAYPGPEEVLYMATMGGARAIGESDRIGSITPGKRADVMVVEPRALNFAPRGDWIAQLVFNGRPENVTDVFVDGVGRKRGGELTGTEPARLVAGAEAAARRVWS
ncbi:amidohydrolase family protein [Nocardiopsis ganjiahuensis]|uniref:amidohydrolase family protein n=1 Tax=Nocardiopsis ganjiahuensis TaxID=239984 RepID=UPI00034BBCA0|nr:amidohydrolase family protein [Nocardiopsis ganjiahuensis]